MSPFGEETVAALRHDALQLQASVALHRPHQYDMSQNLRSCTCSTQLRATKELQEELASALERKVPCFVQPNRVLPISSVVHS